jgi:hypothetical protein
LSDLMSCSCCRRESPANELSAYNGRCEECWINGALSVPVRGTILTVREAMLMARQARMECVKLRGEL